MTPSFVAVIGAFIRARLGVGAMLLLMAASCRKQAASAAVETETVTAALASATVCALSPCGCAAAYSMTRAMTPSWAQNPALPLFQVVRDSDGNTLDVKQTASQTADWTGLFNPTSSSPMGFCATLATSPAITHCYVSKVYDQSGNGNDLSPYTGIERPNYFQGEWYPYGVDCENAGYLCSPPLSISSKYNLPVLFTPFPTGLADCANGHSSPQGGSCTQGLPVGAADKAVFVYLDNRQGSHCCGTNGLEEPYTGQPSDVIPGTMFAVGGGFGQKPGYLCSSPNAYCADVDLEAEVGTWDGQGSSYPDWNYGTNAAEILIQSKYTSGVPPMPQPYISTSVNNVVKDHGTPAPGINSGDQVRVGLAGDATPVQEVVYELAILSCSPSDTTDTAIYQNVSSFYAAARAAAGSAQGVSGSTSLGPGDIAALNSNANGTESTGTLPTDNALYSRMFGGWGLRRLNASYPGPLARLRRSSDGVQQYFGASSSGRGLDPAAASFCANTTCSVTSLPCQAFVTPSQGAAWAAAHDTAACPALTPPQVTSGPTVTFNSLNNQATMHFNGTQSLCHATPTAMRHDWSVATVARQTSGASTMAVVVGMNGGATQLTYFANTASWKTVAGGSAAVATGATTNIWHSLIGLDRNGTGLVYLDGVASPSMNVGDTPGGSSLCIGQASPAGDFPFTGDVAEVTLSYDLTGATGAGTAPDDAAYADVNTGNVLFNNQQLAWGPLNNTSGINQAVSSPAIFVQSSGEADVAVVGPNNSLTYYHAKPNVAWSAAVQVAGPQTTFSSPSIFVRPNGEIDLVAMGPNNSLMYYALPQGGVWTSSQIAGPLTTDSAPSLYVRAANPAGEADVVVQGPDDTVMYYSLAPNSASWASTQIDGPLAGYSQPSLFVRDAANSSPAGEADVAVQGPNNSLSYYFLPLGGTWSPRTMVAPAGTTFSAPTLVVRTGNPANEADIVAQGPSNALDYYYALPGFNFTAVMVAANAAYAAPGFVVQSTGEADIIAQGANHTLTLYSATPPGGLITQNVATVPAGYAPPRIFARSATPAGERDVVTVGPDNSLAYYFDPTGTGAWSHVNIDGNQTAF